MWSSGERKWSRKNSQHEWFTWKWKRMMRKTEKIEREGDRKMDKFLKDWSSYKRNERKICLLILIENARNMWLGNRLISMKLSECVVFTFESNFITHAKLWIKNHTKKSFKSFSVFANMFFSCVCVCECRRRVFKSESFVLKRPNHKWKIHTKPERAKWKGKGVLRRQKSWVLINAKCICSKWQEAEYLREINIDR